MERRRGSRAIPRGWSLVPHVNQVSWRTVRCERVRRVSHRGVLQEVQRAQHRQRGECPPRDSEYSWVCSGAVAKHPPVTLDGEGAEYELCFRLAALSHQKVTIHFYAATGRARPECVRLSTTYLANLEFDEIHLSVRKGCAPGH